MRYYPLARPYITARERSMVLEVLRSPTLSIGPKQDLFERAFAKRIGTRFAVAVSSGTAGLHLALLAAGIGPKDEVITTPFSFVASANAILFVGAKPVFVDIDPVSFNLNPKNIERAITKRTRAILVVHVFGQPCDMAPIMAIARRHNLKVIEDACESLDAFYRGRRVGTFGESAVFSFYPNKQMTTGEGGMIVTNSRHVYDLCRSLRNQGRGEDMAWLDHVRLGYNYRMHELSAALGLAQLEKLTAVIRKRREIAGWYHKEFGAVPDLIEVPHVAEGSRSSWFLYVIKIKPKSTKQDFVIKELAKKGVQAKPYFPSIHLFQFYRKTFHYKKGGFPVSEAVSRQSIALPFYHALARRDIRAIAKIVIDTIRRI